MKGDADAAGRLLLGIPADLDDAERKAVEATLIGADPRFWVALEGARDWIFWGGHGLPTGNPVATDSVPALMVKALMADGWVRERAVRSLVEAGSRAALPVLGLRAADWVSAVREVARPAIDRWLADDADGGALAAVAPMAFLLAGRREGRWLVTEVRQRLAAPVSRPVVTRLLTSSDRSLRRAAYEVVLEKGELSLEQAVSAALRDRDIVIRKSCAAYASRMAIDTGDLAAARRMLASRTPLVRTEALQALNRLGDRSSIQSVLCDRSSLVRGTARFYLRPHGVDFAEVYRLRLEEGGDAVTPGAVAGLAEVGTAEDAELLRNLVDHPRAKVRMEALRGLRLDTR